jgi:cyclohexanone monooxygenase
MDKAQVANGRDCDAAIVGAGFGGLYALHKLRNELGLDVRAFDDAGGVGGTWYWNRYPGARSDTEVTAYCYSFDRQLWEDWQWTERYPRQAEILAYLNEVAERHDLRRSIEFNTRIVRAEWNEHTSRWCLTTDKNETFSAQFLIEGVGLLSSTNYPEFPGTHNFKGEIVHTSRWPHAGIDLRGKRVGVIGTGSSGIQVIAELAPQVAELCVFQRTPQYVVPSQHSPISEAALAAIRQDYAGYWRGVLNSATAFGIEESTIPAASVSREEREAVFERAWQAGGGFRFMLGTFSDIISDLDANDAATDFIRRKIRALVHNAEVAAALTPSDLYAKRPLCCDGYYECFNRENVTLVDIKNHPITAITESGILTAAGHYELDVIIFATGFDAVTGNYLKIDTRGRGGLTLQDKWAHGPRAFIGLTIADFPNLFMIFGPFGPFTNQPPVHEFQINWIADAIKHARTQGFSSFAVSKNVEDRWIEECNEIANTTLFPRVDSWINGANIVGKPKATMFYMGGMAAYAVKLCELAAHDYPGFVLDGHERQ